MNLGVCVCSANACYVGAGRCYLAATCTAEYVPGGDPGMNVLAAACCKRLE